MSIFTDMLAGREPAVIIDEDEHHFCIVAAHPNRYGHVICVPKQEAHDLYALPPEKLLALMKYVQRTARALQTAIPCKKVGTACISLAVPHIHIHLVPLQCGEDMNFTLPRNPLPQHEMLNIANLIRTQLLSL